VTKIYLSAGTYTKITRAVVLLTALTNPRHSCRLRLSLFTLFVRATYICFIIISARANSTYMAEVFDPDQSTRRQLGWQITPARHFHTSGIDKIERPFKRLYSGLLHRTTGLYSIVFVDHIIATPPVPLWSLSTHSLRAASPELFLYILNRMY